MLPTDATDRHSLHGAQPVLLVPDVAATLAFYNCVLGFHIDFQYGDPPTHARVFSGDRTRANATWIRFEKAGAPLPETPSCYLFVYVGADIDGLCRTFQANGVQIVRSLEDRPWGARVFNIRDLNGHELQFVQPFDP